MTQNRLQGRAGPPTSKSSVPEFHAHALEASAVASPSLGGPATAQARDFRQQAPVLTGTAATSTLPGRSLHGSGGQGAGPTPAPAHPDVAIVPHIKPPPGLGDETLGYQGLIILNKFLQGLPVDLPKIEQGDPHTPGDRLSLWAAGVETTM